jgi:hypothetical protein
MILSTFKYKYLHSYGVCIQTSAMIICDLKGSHPGTVCDVCHIEQCNCNKFYLAMPYDPFMATKYIEWIKAAMIIVQFLDYSTNLAQDLHTPFGRP